MQPTRLLPHLHLFPDTCNVYVLVDGDHAIAVDFGSGAWLEQLPALGVRHLDHVLLTHAHDDQCHGLASRRKWPFTIHAPGGEQTVLAPERDPRVLPPWFAMGCPANYLPSRQPVADVKYDMGGNGHLLWRGQRLRFMHTPGHGPNACSVLADVDGRQVLLCGDAVHAGGTVWQPFHLEWDHWTGAGALAAWEGIERLRGLDLGLLGPSHGPVVATGIQPTLRTLSKRLMDFYHAKGQISPGTKDGYVPPMGTVAGAQQYLPHLYQYAGNGYLLVSDSGHGLVVDPHEPEMPALEALLAELGVRPTAMVVGHYHYDHCDGIPYLREKYGTEAWLHPLMVEALSRQRVLPWLLDREFSADHVWPERGAWRWEEYDFAVAPWPGQTWWHCVFMATVDGRKVMFAGDSFTPTSKWNGTGGFCAYNGSRFSDGYLPSAELALEWQPEIMAAGHNNTYAYSATKFRRIIKWAERAEAAVRALCPSGDAERDYYALHELLKGSK
jgi:glyoxylase-like metal-dependent hydrolase (beta-lactamase superfamily II)